LVKRVTVGPGTPHCGAIRAIIFTAEETRDGVLLRPARRSGNGSGRGRRLFAGKRKAKTVAQMNTASEREVIGTHAAVDTNVVVRLSTGDDVEQAPAAKSLLAAESIWIAKTVLLETVGLKNVHAEDETALHPSSRPPGAEFVSFDQSMVRSAKRAGAADISALKPQ
jgi:hypothetical protein